MGIFGTSHRQNKEIYCMREEIEKEILHDPMSEEMIEIEEAFNEWFETAELNNMFEMPIINKTSTLADLFTEIGTASSELLVSIFKAGWDARKDRNES